MPSKSIFSSPLNPAQLELLQVFAGGLTDEQMAELRRVILDFKFRRVTALADEFVDAKGWNSDDIADDAGRIQRRPYSPPQQILE